MSQPAPLPTAMRASVPARVRTARRSAHFHVVCRVSCIDFAAGNAANRTPRKLPRCRHVIPTCTQALGRPPSRTPCAERREPPDPERRGSGARGGVARAFKRSAAPPREARRTPGSVDLLANRFHRRLGERILGLDLEGALELLERLGEHALRPVDLPEVAVRVVTRLVAGRLDGRLEPWDRLVEATELDQVRADVVVGIAELRIDGDRLLAPRDRGVQVALER